MGIRACLRLLPIGAILPMALTPGPPGTGRYDSRVDLAATGVQSEILGLLTGLETEGLVRRDGTSVPGTFRASKTWEGSRVARIEGEMTAEVDLAGLRPALDGLALGDLLHVPPVPATSVMRFDLDTGFLVESVLRMDLSREVMGMSTVGWSTMEIHLIR
jgi:hypothetical protein